ncbi:MAG: glycerol-3-phosphate acyltransferase [Lachnospiraceae bacterium]|nr:glycerol-3-phosphate acyltransferase [Lachnospiraceae bacterium]
MREYLFFIILGYLCGSIRFGYLLPKVFCNVDVTALSDDGNPGVANAFQFGGIPVGIVTLLGELAKGALPVSMAVRAGLGGQMAFALVLLAPVLGHAYPIFCLSGGGKAIAVTFGTLIGLLPLWKPLEILIFWYLVFSLVFIITPHLQRSIVTFTAFAIHTAFTVPDMAVVVGCILISGIVIWKHAIKYQGEKMEYHPVWHRK